jgi:hypothetical protein
MRCNSELESNHSHTVQTQNFHTICDTNRILDYQGFYFMSLFKNLMQALQHVLETRY